MPKFRVTGKVSSFLGPDGKRYFPGDIVSLPSRYMTLEWLESLETPKPVKAKEVEAKEIEVPREAEAPTKRGSRKKTPKK